MKIEKSGTVDCLCVGEAYQIFKHSTGRGFHGLSTLKLVGFIIDAVIHDKVAA